MKFFNSLEGIPVSKKTSPLTPKKLMVLGAHPDDCELMAGGFAALCAQRGWKVKFVSVTSGNAGHQDMSPRELAKRRLREGHKAAGRIGATFETLGEPDGRLFVTETTTRKVVGVIRRFQPDILVCPRTCDYHRDHRATGQLALDASYLLGVPLAYPGTPVCRVPVILYACDSFTEGPPFTPNLFVDIAPVMPVHLQMLSDHESQVFEWLPWISGDKTVSRKNPVKDRQTAVMNFGGKRAFEVARRYAKELKRKYRRTVKAALAFQVSEYGRPVSAPELNRIFPF